MDDCGRIVTGVLFVLFCSLVFALRTHLAMTLLTPAGMPEADRIEKFLHDTSPTFRMLSLDAFSAISINTEDQGAMQWTNRVPIEEAIFNAVASVNSQVAPLLRDMTVVCLYMKSNTIYLSVLCVQRIDLTSVAKFEMDLEQETGNYILT